MKKERSSESLDRFYFTSAERQAREAELGVTTDELLRRSVVDIQPQAMVPVSDFRVGVAGLNAEGEMFVGVNLEFGGASFAQTIHAEQFLICYSRMRSTSPLVKLAASAAPCGHCRQFLTEFDSAGKLEMLLGDQPITRLANLLPQAFGPDDLGVTEPFYGQTLSNEFDDLEEAARAAALHAYVPYSKTRAGTAVKVDSGEIFCGSAIENAAFNPTLPPLQAAIIAAYANGVTPDRIVEVVFSQDECRHIDYIPQQRNLSQTLGGGAVRFTTVRV